VEYDHWWAQQVRRTRFPKEKKKLAQTHQTIERRKGFTYRLAFLVYYGVTSVILNGKTKA
jgi:hypothetical protein